LALVGVVFGVTALVAAGCSSGSGGSGGGGEAASATTSATTSASATTTTTANNEIKLTAQNTSWSTTSLRFASGAKITVEVTNKDSIEHNFTFKETSTAKDVEAGEDASINFTAPAAGSYKFFCKYHPSAMTGNVAVI